MDEAYQTLLDSYNQLVPVTKQELYNLVNCAIQEQGNYSSNSFAEASDELTGTLDGQKEIVLTYLLSSDKTNLEERIKNKANQNDYVLQTYQVYIQVYQNAIATGNALLTTDTTADAIQRAIQNIHETRNQLTLSAFIVASTNISKCYCYWKCIINN